MELIKNLLNSDVFWNLASIIILADDYYGKYELKKPYVLSARRIKLWLSILCGVDW